MKAAPRPPGVPEITWRAMTEHCPHARAPIEIKVEYRRLNAFFADYTRNISRGATFIESRGSLPLGTRFRFRLCVPGGADPLEVTGEVVHAESTGEEAGMSIRFLWADEGERRAFERAVEQLMSESLGPLVTARLLERAGRLP